jgi:cytochrome c oxidase cbb3-type subunit 3
MRWLWLGVGVVLLGLCVAAQAAHRGALRAALLRAEPDSIAADATLLDFAKAEALPAWQQHCAACHGATLRGDAGLGVPDLTRPERLYGTNRVADLERTILYGIRSGHPKAWNRAEMPAFAKPTPYRRYAVASLAPGEIGDLVAFLRAGNGTSADPAAVARGRALFGAKGQCFDCHAVDARGDNAIGAPDLLRGAWLYGRGTVAALTDSISDGRGGVCPAWVAVLPPSTIRALAVFVHDAARTAS